MTRTECETIIRRTLLNLRDVVKAYRPDIDDVNLSIGDLYCWAFAIEGDDGPYLLNVKIDMEEEQAKGEQADGTDS